MKKTDLMPDAQGRVGEAVMVKRRHLPDTLGIILSDRDHKDGPLVAYRPVPTGWTEAHRPGVERIKTLSKSEQAEVMERLEKEALWAQGASGRDLDDDNSGDGDLPAMLRWHSGIKQNALIVKDEYRRNFAAYRMDGAPVGCPRGMLEPPHVDVPDNSPYTGSYWDSASKMDGCGQGTSFRRPGSDEVLRTRLNENDELVIVEMDWERVKVTPLSEFDEPVIVTDWFLN